MYYARKAEPRSSKLLYEREIAARHKRHRERLRRMKASVDNKPPKRFVHLERNLKKEQMQEDRYARIEHENRLLLHRMSEIMNRSSTEHVSTAAKYGKSLNRDARRKELQRITAENQAILRRIQGAEPVYNHWKWEEEGMKHSRLVESISEFPVARGSRRSRPHAAAAAASMSTGVLPRHRPADMGMGYDETGGRAADAAAAEFAHADPGYGGPRSASAAGGYAGAASASAGYDDGMAEFGGSATYGEGDY